MRDILRKQATVNSISIEEDHQSMGVSLDNNQEEILIISDLVRIYDNDKFEIIDLTDIEVGRKLNIYYRENTPMMMSMPPKYSPELIIVDKNDEFMSHKFSYFDEELISADNTVQISDAFVRIVESIEYRPLIKELLVNQELLVFYQGSTKSIPALVNPKKIIIL